MSPRNADTPRFRALILGGTAEARALAQAMVAAGLDVTTALAGRTATPLGLPGHVRTGGFGGAHGMITALIEGGYHALIDATHPFAAAISANAAEAAAVTGLPFLRLSRPAWPDRPGWLVVPGLAEAAASLPPGASVLLAIGRQGIAPFASRPDCRFVARMIEAPDDVPEDWTLLFERGPFTRETEMRLQREHRITHLVSKNSGAAAVAAKLDAAERLGVTVVMVARPALPPAPEVATVAAALAWVTAHAGTPNPSTSKPAST